ncbi:MAG: AraC family transcriptional regulator, partial [bacterium]
TWTQFFTPTDSHRRLGLVCLGAGAHSGPVAPSRLRVLSCYAMVVVRAGDGWMEVNDESAAAYTIRPPALFWLQPGVAYSYGPARGGWSEMWLMFDGSAAAGYVELGYIARDAAPIPVEDLPRMQQGFAQLADICRRGGPHLDVAAAVSVHRIILAAQLAVIGNSRQPDEPVLSALRRNSVLPGSVREHAERLGLSVPELREATRRSAGCGPKEYLLQVRLNEAKHLLATSNLAVAVIARQVGYGDPAYFTRLFTQRVGSSPTQFRLQQQRLPLMSPHRRLS